MLDEGALEQAAEAELSAAQALRDNAYKIPLARHLLVDTLKGLV